MARILIIDDSPVMRNLMSDFLTDAGHEVDSCSDGQEGVAMALQRDYDVCICDLHMPKLNGYEVQKALMADRPEIKLIFTDSLPDHLSDKVREAGASYCLKKPFELNQLREILESLLKPTRTK
jgi:CheY-like chemotaxis protein